MPSIERPVPRYSFSISEIRIFRLDLRKSPKFHAEICRVRSVRNINQSDFPIREYCTDQGDNSTLMVYRLTTTWESIKLLEMSVGL